MGILGFYAVANGAANFMLAIVSSVFGPLVPAVSSMQSGSTPGRIGDLCIKTTRYCVLLLLLLGLPLFFGAYPLLSLWVGKRYAIQSALYLEVLVLGNIVRQIAFPYILVVVATGKQHLATIGGIVEACVNVALSIWLVQRIGTVGVAVGTLGGRIRRPRHASAGKHPSHPDHDLHATLAFPAAGNTAPVSDGSAVVVPLSLLEKTHHASG